MRRQSRHGLTLIEVMLVLVILVVLASAVGLYARQAQKKALMDAARAQIGDFKTCIEVYQQHVYSYPSTTAGLQALIAPPNDLRNPDKWAGPYLDANVVPLDPWDGEYQYQLIDADNYVIWSLGPDGVDGSEDDIRSNDATTQ
ncbi:MAG: type II secretion system major pseudopilin GspG [Planctomycetales bacterium]|nr:type II secretion system major pseudopilin GspG [Planctomycetales bacterium]